MKKFDAKMLIFDKMIAFLNLAIFSCLLLVMLVLRQFIHREINLYQSFLLKLSETLHKQYRYTSRQKFYTLVLLLQIQQQNCKILNDYTIYGFGNMEYGIPQHVLADIFVPNYQI